VTKDRVMVMASEVGVYDAPPEAIVQKGRLMPGKMLLVDTAEQRIIEDDEIKTRISTSRPHGDWWRQHVTLDMLRKGFKQAGLWIRIDLIQIRIQHFCSIRIQNRIQIKNRIRIQAKTELSKTISFSNFFEIKI
jgi:hypothetical protein